MRNIEFLSDLSVSIYRSLVGVDVYVSYPSVMRRRMVFCEIICQILKTWSPVSFKLAFFHSILDPVKAHVHGFCTLLFDCTISVSCCSGVVSFHWCGGLIVPQLLQCRSEDSSCLCIYENCSNFCFCC
jgi:hypothetical protein